MMVIPREYRAKSKTDSKDPLPRAHEVLKLLNQMNAGGAGAFNLFPKAYEKQHEEEFRPAKSKVLVPNNLDLLTEEER